MRSPCAHIAAIPALVAREVHVLTKGVVDPLDFAQSRLSSMRELERPAVAREALKAPGRRGKQSTLHNRYAPRHQWITARPWGSACSSATHRAGETAGDSRKGLGRYRSPLRNLKRGPPIRACAAPRPRTRSIPPVPARSARARYPARSAPAGRPGPASPRGSLRRHGDNCLGHGARHRLNRERPVRAHVVRPSRSRREPGWSRARSP